MDFLKLIHNSNDENYEKHLPIIKLQKNHVDSTKNIIKVIVGENIKHPNIIEHSIKWIELYIITKDQKIKYIGKQDFEPSYCYPEARFKIEQEILNEINKIVAISYCNLHGLWINSLDV